MPYLSEASNQALMGVVESIERTSAAEVVVAVRERSGSMLQTDLLAGSLTALLALACMLFSPFALSVGTILLATALFGAFGALACSRLPSARYWLTPRRLAEQDVQRAARAEFFDAHISETRGRTGILVYVSQTERLAVVLADSGVRNAVDVAAWEACVRRIRQVARQRDALALAQSVGELSAVLTRCLPRAADDINELPDQVR